MNLIMNENMNAENWGSRALYTTGSTGAHVGWPRGLPLPDGFDPLAKARGRQLNGTASSTGHFYRPILVGS